MGNEKSLHTSFVQHKCGKVASGMHLLYIPTTHPGPIIAREQVGSDFLPTTKQHGVQD